MPLALLLDAIPEYARDLKLNLSAVLAQPELSAQQAWGTAVSCAIASKSPRLTEALAVEAAQHIGERAVAAAKTAAAIMGMNNIYYRFRHLSGNPKIRRHAGEAAHAGIAFARGRRSGFRALVSRRFGHQRVPGLRRRP